MRLWLDSGRRWGARTVFSQVRGRFAGSPVRRARRTPPAACRRSGLRSVEGAERAVNTAIELCVEKGFRACARMCAYRGNLGALRQTVNHLASLGCASLHVGCVNGMGEWLRNAADLTPTFEELLEACLRYLPQYYEDGMPLPLTLAGAFSASQDRPDHYAIAPYRPGFENCTGAVLCAAKAELSGDSNATLIVRECKS